MSNYITHDLNKPYAPKADKSNVIEDLPMNYDK